MNLSLLVSFFLSILHLNAGKLLNIEVTLHQNDVPSLFAEEEVWGFDYVNQTERIVVVNVVIDESKWLNMTTQFKDIIFSFNTIYDDVEKVLDLEFGKLSNRTRWTAEMEPDTFFLNYRDWIEYEAFIEYLVLTYPNILSRSYIGVTIQGRNIPILRLSTGGSNRPAFYIQAELHAREWLANAATTFILNELAAGYGTDTTITNILNNINIFIVPTVNIDGYIFSWSSSNNRMWRKNRRNNGNNIFGVDLNRNYQGPQFCQVGASTNPSSDTYCGTGPFSEPESYASSQFILAAANNIQAVFDMHTYGPLILWPWAYTYSQCPDYNALRSLGASLQSAVHAVNNHVYTSQQASDLYPCAGTVIDFGYTNGIVKTFTFEGRGPGFNAPASNIIPAGQEQLAAVKVLAQTLY